MRYKVKIMTNNNGSHLFYSHNYDKSELWHNYDSHDYDKVIIDMKITKSQSYEILNQEIKSWNWQKQLWQL